MKTANGNKDLLELEQEDCKHKDVQTFEIPQALETITICHDCCKEL
jgi:hypothetical protein